MAVVIAAASDTQAAFDGVAATYDRSNAANPLLCAARQRSRAALEALIGAGSRVLDLGCGPGTDAIYLAGKGYHVTAIDSSMAMVEEAARAAGAAGVGGQMRVVRADIEEIDRCSALGEQRFDAAYSSFGPLNCVGDLSAAARAIAHRLQSGGWLVASVIGRLCPWELAVYALKGDLARARIRFARRSVAVPLEGRTVWTRYYAPHEFAEVFGAAGFETVSSRALGVFTPPPYLDAFARRHATLIAALQRVEDVAGAWPGIRACGDHFLTVLRRA